MRAPARTQTPDWTIHYISESANLGVPTALLSTLDWLILHMRARACRHSLGTLAHTSTRRLNNFISTMLSEYNISPFCNKNDISLQLISYTSAKRVREQVVEGAGKPGEEGQKVSLRNV